MKPFLYQVAACFYEQLGSEINQLAFVFPNRRTGLFFQKYLAEIAGKPLFSPTILTISDLFVQLSGRQSVDKISMLFTLYELYVELSGSAETFDEFLYWGEMLLNDFDDVDKYMVDAKMLFSNVTDLKEIEEDYSFLSQEQIEAIRTFWTSFYPKGDTPNQKEFLAVWEILYPLYAALKETLSEQGKGYEGMIFREVVEQTRNKEAEFSLPYKQIVFVGLNALSTSEEMFLAYLQNKQLADFYWDYSSTYVTDPDNKASHFVERNKRQFPSQHTLPEEPNEMPEIEVVGIPSGVGQAKQLYTMLSELSQGGELDKEEALKTAIVLPDEALLIPVLNSIPENIKKINVTMGYPLTGTPIAGLMDYILTMQKNIRYVDGKPMFNFRDVLPILNHRYVMSSDTETITLLVKDIVAYNKITMSYDDLHKTPLLGVLFTPIQNVESCSQYLIEVLQTLNKWMEADALVDEGDDTPRRTQDMEQEFVFHYFTTVNRMQEVMREAGVEMRIDTYFKLLRRMTDMITIPFHGEPLSGLQIMGVLETRALDFDRLIMLSMNEGVFPKKRSANSFIPYNLRRGFALPTYEHQDSVWAYHFYRLIKRAKQVSLVYDTRNTGGQTGEVSRYIHQLNFHYGVKLKQKLITYNVSSAQSPIIQVPKTDEIMQKLEAFMEGGKRAISASAVNTYLDCQLKFYYNVVEGIRDEDEVTETVESNVMGSIIHKVLEDLYHPFCGKQVTADLFQLIKKDKKLVTHTIEKAFAEIFFKRERITTLTGQNFLIGEIIRKYIEKILYWDAKLTPFYYLESEKRVNAVLQLTSGRALQLKGFIDRVDEVDKCVRIVDYKSGLGDATFETVESLFDTSLKDRSKAVMQVFMYAWMYAKETERTTLIPAIYYMRTLFEDKFEPGVMLRIGRGKKELVTDFAPYQMEFETALRTCMDELFDADRPFIQTAETTPCAYCKFKSICGR